MRILIVGSGGREHALAWRCRHEGHEVVVTPGSEGIGCQNSVAETDHEGMLALVDRERIELAIVGPEAPLVDGLADRLRGAGLPTIGPGREAAALEGSKAHAKSFMHTHAIPCARSVTVTSLSAARAAMRDFEQPPVVKASGLAGGKGVSVAETWADAEDAVVECLEGRFGAAGNEVVLEERLVGEEASFFVLTDGTHTASFVACQDHKRIGDGDTGPNTGGMGAYAPAPIVDDTVHSQIMETIVQPTLAGLRGEGRPFVGVLFVGLMIHEGRAKVIEYNVRFGDPEVQPLMLGLDIDLVPRLVAAASGTLTDQRLPGTPAATVVVAAPGYPKRATKGLEIRGLADLMRDAESDPKLAIFHAGTTRDSGGVWRTNGGRVLGVCARGDDLRHAIARAYSAVNRISIEGGQFRRDIGHRAIGPR